MRFRNTLTRALRVLRVLEQHFQISLRPEARPSGRGKKTMQDCRSSCSRSLLSTGIQGACCVLLALAKGTPTAVHRVSHHRASYSRHSIQVSKLALNPKLQIAASLASWALDLLAGDTYRQSRSSCMSSTRAIHARPIGCHTTLAGCAPALFMIWQCKVSSGVQLPWTNHQRYVAAA